MDYIYFPYMMADPTMYNIFPVGGSMSNYKRGIEGPSSRLVHEYCEDEIIAE